MGANTAGATNLGAKRFHWDLATSIRIFVSPVARFSLAIRVDGAVAIEANGG
jgi:hypothetical protein